MEIDKNEFIKDLRERKPAAQERLLNEYGPFVFRMVVRMVGQREDAEEVYQDVFVKAMTKISTYDPRKAKLSTWLSRIAYNESLNHIRRSKMELISMNDIEMIDDYDYIETEDTYNEHTILLLEKAMTILPSADQTLLSLFYYDDMSLEEIAYITGLKTSTVGSRLSRIRRKLHKIIKKITDQ